MVYLVQKQGVFCHGIHGVSFEEQKAITMAKSLAAADSDDYHAWNVIAVPVDSMHPTVEVNNSEHCGWTEGAVLFSTIHSIEI